MLDLVVRGKKVLVNGEIKPASIHVCNGVTVGIGGYEGHPGAKEVIEVGDDQVVMAGLVDSHVHVNEPGRTEWEGFETATKAAAAGGVTTIIDMPLNSSPVTTTFAALQEKITSMDKQLWVDVGLLGGVVPQNQSQIEKMIKEGGVVGFKCFLIHSGIDEFPAVSEDDVCKAMEVFKKLGEEGMDVPYMFHAELAGPIDKATASLEQSNAHPAHYSTFLHSRPKEAENEAIALVCKLAQKYKVPSHIVHLSSAEAIPQLAAAQQNNVPVTVETTFHYLHLTSEKVPHGNTQFKCCPPIREKENQEALWKGLADGVITLAISDHSPCIAELKRLSEGDFMKAWGGIASLQLGLPIMWTEARKRNFSLLDIQKWMCDEPAKLVRLNDTKGPIQIGRDADFVIWNPDEEFEVDQTKLLFKNRLSPYHGERLFGRVSRTIVRGQTVFVNSEVSKSPVGTRLVPTRTSSRATYPTPLLPPIHRLNTLPRSLFQHAINLLFETAPPLFEPLWEKRPYESYDQLIETAKTVMHSLSPADRLAVINAHPRIGLNPAQLSSLSKHEQGSENSEAVFEELRKLNTEYESKFGFKFVVFVNGRQKSEIIPVLQKRLTSDKDSELELGLSEMMAIAKDRLKKLLK